MFHIDVAMMYIFHTHVANKCVFGMLHFATRDLNVPINMKQMLWWVFIHFSTDELSSLCCKKMIFDVANVNFLMLQMMILDITLCGPHHPNGALHPNARALATPFFCRRAALSWLTAPGTRLTHGQVIGVAHTRGW
jgi:hypothetical protein